MPDNGRLGPESPESGLPGRRLSELAEKAVCCTAECCGASTTVTGQGGEQPAVVTHPDLSALVSVQLRTGIGPIPAAAEQGQAVAAADLLREERWPQYRALALHSGVRACLTLPFRRGDLTMTLSLYSFHPGGLAEAEYGAARALGDLAATGLARDRAYRAALAEVDHLDAALRSRPVVDQASGIIMYVLHCGPEAAFGVLRRISQRSNRKLAEVAQTVVDTRGHGLERQLHSLAPPGPQAHPPPGATVAPGPSPGPSSPAPPSPSSPAPPPP